MAWYVRIHALTHKTKQNKTITHKHTQSFAHSFTHAHRTYQTNVHIQDTLRDTEKKTDMKTKNNSNISHIGNAMCVN